MASLNTQTRPRLVQFAGILGLCLAAVACGGGGPSAPTPTATPTPAPVPTVRTPWGGTVRLTSKTKVDASGTPGGVLVCAEYRVPSGSTQYRWGCAGRSSVNETGGAPFSIDWDGPVPPEATGVVLSLLASAGIGQVAPPLPADWEAWRGLFDF